MVVAVHEGSSLGVSDRTPSLATCSISTQPSASAGLVSSSVKSKKHEFGLPTGDYGWFTDRSGMGLAVTNSALTEEGGTIPITKRISGAETANIYTCHVVVAKGRSYNCELLPDLSRTTLPRLPCGATGISTNATYFSQEKEVTFGDYSFNLNLNKNTSKNF